MKLRIRGNSVRLRLSKSELEQIAEAGFAEDAVRFPTGPALRYRLEVGATDTLAATFGESVVKVVVPEAQIRRWLEPDEVSIRGEQPLADGAVLRILVEKDFECLVPRPDEDSSDLFENPRSSH